MHVLIERVGVLLACVIYQDCRRNCQVRARTHGQITSNDVCVRFSTRKLLVDQALNVYCLKDNFSQNVATLKTFSKTLCGSVETKTKMDNNLKKK